MTPNTPGERAGRFHCPFCNHSVREDETSCPSCGRAFRYKTERMKRKEQKRGKEPDIKMCPVCKSFVFPGASGCSFCGTRFRDAQGQPVGDIAPVEPQTIELDEKLELNICPRCKAFVRQDTETCQRCGTSLAEEKPLSLREISLDSEIALDVDPEAHNTFERYWAAIEMEIAKRRAERELHTTTKRVKPLKVKKLASVKTRYRFMEVVPPLPREGAQTVRMTIMGSMMAAIAFAFICSAIPGDEPFKFGALAAVLGAVVLVYLAVLAMALRENDKGFRYRVVELLGVISFFTPAVLSPLPNREVDLTVAIGGLASLGIFIIYFSLINRIEWRDVWLSIVGVGFGASVHSIGGLGPVNSTLVVFSLIGCVVSGFLLIVSRWRSLTPSKKDWETLARSRREGLGAPTYKGVYLLKMGDYAGALAAIDGELKEFQTDWVLWNNRGNALAHLGRYNEALECYDRAIALNEQYDVAWNNKGNTLARQMRYDEALWCYDKALAINPGYKQVLLNKTEVYTRMGRIVRV